MCILGDHIKRTSIYPLPQGYHALSSFQIAPSLGSLAQVLVAFDLGKPSIPNPSVPNPGFAYSYPISSTTRGKPLAQVVSLLSGVTYSTGQSHLVEQPTVIVPSTNTKCGHSSF